MDRHTLSFVALAASVLFGAGFTVVDAGSRATYAVIGGAIVALLWIAVGRFGRSNA